MYLYGVRSASNLGRLMGPRAKFAQRRRQRLNGMRGRRGLGQTDEDFNMITYAQDQAPLPFTGSADALTNDYFSLDPLTAPAGMVSTPAGTFAVPSTYASPQTAAFTALQNSAVNSSSPLDYTSPSAAVAAGVPAATVASQWSTAQGVNSFATPQAATAALTAVMGASAAAAQVARLWAGGPGVYQQPSFFNGSTAGIPNVLLLGGLALVLVISSGGGGRR
jgi:hypothetical protein